MADRPTDIIEENVRIDCQGDGMEGVLTYPEREPVTAGCLLAAPHPALGGNFDNNVILAIARDWAARAMLTLRFNYRGVGASEGPVPILERIKTFTAHPHVPADGGDDLHDLAAAYASLDAALPPNLPLHLVGYSYGAALLFSFQQHAARPRPGATLLVSPPLTHCAANALQKPIPACACVMAENDLALTREDLRLIPWLKQDAIATIADCDHFYIGREEQVAREGYTLSIGRHGQERHNHIGESAFDRKDGD